MSNLGAEPIKELRSIGILDDHPIIVDGIVASIKNAIPSKTKINRFTNSKDLKLFLEKDDLDILILDIGLPGNDGITVSEWLRVRSPNTRIIIFSASKSIAVINRVVKNGLWGYVNKGSGTNVLIAAISQVAGGERFWDSSVMNSSNAEELLVAALAPKELRIFGLIADGLSYKEIAEEMNITVQTVGSYRTRIGRKLNVQTKRDLMLVAIKCNIGNS